MIPLSTVLNIIAGVPAPDPAAPVASGMIKVMIITMDTGTSERWAVETEVDKIGPVQIIKAYEAELAKCAGEMAPEYPSHLMKYWLPKGDKPCSPASFIMETYDPAFGPIRVMGFVEIMEEDKRKKDYKHHLTST